MPYYSGVANLVLFILATVVEICVHACVRACVCVCVHACVRVHIVSVRFHKCYMHMCILLILFRLDIWRVPVLRLACKILKHHAANMNVLPALSMDTQ